MHIVEDIRKRTADCPIRRRARIQLLWEQCPLRWVNADANVSHWLTIRFSQLIGTSCFINHRKPDGSSV